MAHGVGQIPEICVITPATTSYALRLDDGTVVRFDPASNAKIAAEIQSHRSKFSNKNKPVHVRVMGTMPADVIVLETIKM